MPAIPIVSPLRKKISLYSDIRKDLDINPITKDLAVKRDEEAVKESIRTLILTDRGERLFQPRLGGDIRKTLFENNTPATLKVLQEAIKDTINNHEPRANLIDVEVSSTYDDNKVVVNIVFYVRNLETPVNLTVFLERIR